MLPPDRRRFRRPALVLAALAALATVAATGTGCSPATPPTVGSTSSPATRAPSSGARLPAPDHVVVVIMENRAAGEVIGDAEAPYVNGTLAAGGAVLSQFRALTHPSQPNYYILFSGSAQGVTDDSCVTPGFSSAPNLASELLAAGLGWASYNEGLPGRGSTVCTAGRYARKHNPWFGFSNVPTDTALPLTALPGDWSRLPKVSFVVPDLCHDMHDCSVRTGDRWLQDRLGGYAAWARTHNSLLVLTFDEDDRSGDNRIPTVVYGAHTAPGSTTATRYDHRDLLRTLEDLSGLSTHAGGGADITGIWN